jgi:hypothetical protein
MPATAALFLISLTMIEMPLLVRLPQLQLVCFAAGVSTDLARAGPGLGSRAAASDGLRYLQVSPSPLLAGADVAAAADAAGDALGFVAAAVTPGVVAAAFVGAATDAAGVVLVLLSLPQPERAAPRARKAVAAIKTFKSKSFTEARAQWSRQRVARRTAV